MGLAAGLVGIPGALAGELELPTGAFGSLDAVMMSRHGERWRDDLQLAYFNKHRALSEWMDIPYRLTGAYTGLEFDYLQVTENMLGALRDWVPANFKSIGRCWDYTPLRRESDFRAIVRAEAALERGEIVLYWEDW